MPRLRKGESGILAPFTVRRSRPASYDKAPASGAFAQRTGLEPATSAVTGQRSNQLSYRCMRKVSKTG